MKVNSKRLIAAQPRNTADRAIGAKTDRAAAIAARSSKDTFEMAPAPSSILGYNQRGCSAPQTGVARGAPGVPGRTGVSELNPFGAQVAPTTTKGGVLSDMAAGMDKGMTVPMGLDQAARSAAIRTEVESGIGNHTGPNSSPDAGDLGFEVFGVDPVKVIENADYSGVTQSMIGAGVSAGATAAVGAAAASAFSGGAATPSIPLVTAQVGVSAAVGAGVTKVVEETWASYQREKKKNAEKNKAPPPAPATPPGGVPPEKAAPPPAETTPPPKEEKKADEPPPPPPPPPPEDKDAGSSFDPMRGSRGSYEANRDAYLGHADGTPVGARGTSVATGAANSRRTNPGRDGEQEVPAAESIRDVRSELTHTNESSARNDARAATLGSLRRVTERVSITDGNSDEDNNGGSGRPKGNGLVR